MSFCPKCGQQVADGQAFCPSCGNPMASQSQPNFNNQNNFYVSPQVKQSNTISLVLGITGLSIGMIGGIMFGLFCSLPALAMGIVALLMAINTRKETNNAMGSGAMICAVLAIVFATIFTLGCLACRCGDIGSYSCYGLVGGTCKANNDVNNALNSFFR